MTRPRTARAALVLATAVAAGLVAAVPAAAETLRTDDGADATASSTDLRTVRVTHGADQVRLRTTYPNLRKRGASYQTLFLDLDPDRRGPEYALGTPLFSGGEYALVRMRRWRAASGPLSCDYSVDLRWRRDVATTRVDRDCLRRPGRVRVALVMEDVADEERPVTDWLEGRRRFTRWLAPGSPA